MRLTDKPYYKQPWYNSYRSMMDRCYRKGAANYRQYGGRGIEVCEEWQDIESFAIWCEASGYSNGLTIERIDVNGNYSPSNCKWATHKQIQNLPHNRCGVRPVHKCRCNGNPCRMCACCGCMSNNIRFLWSRLR